MGFLTSDYVTDVLDDLVCGSVLQMNMQTPLHLAAVHGYLDITQLLVTNGADVNQPDSDHMTPVHRYSSYQWRIQGFQEKGANPKPIIWPISPEKSMTRHTSSVTARGVPPRPLPDVVPDVGAPS